MTQLLDKAALANLTVAQILELNKDSVEKLRPFETYPEGLAVGVIEKWELPASADESFSCTILLAQYIEFKNPEDQETFQLREGSKLTVSYNTTVGVQALVGEWDLVLDQFGGNIGQMMANSAGMAINFQITKRKGKKKKDDGSDMFFNGVSKVTPV